MVQARKQLRLKEYDYSSEGLYFITMCVENRECLFGDIRNGKVVLNNFGKIIENVWGQLPQRYPNIELDEYIIMPNHIHGIINITLNVGAIHELPLHDVVNRRRMLLPRMIGYFKMNSAKQINLIRGISGKLWQRNYYEHIIRNEEDLNRIQQYIQNNASVWPQDQNNPNQERQESSIFPARRDGWHRGSLTIL